MQNGIAGNGFSTFTSAQKNLFLFYVNLFLFELTFRKAKIKSLR